MVDCGRDPQGHEPHLQYLAAPGLDLPLQPADLPDEVVEVQAPVGVGQQDGGGRRPSTVRGGGGTERR